MRDIELIPEPLITDDGCLNPVAYAMMEAAIANMPNIDERTAGEPEWEQKHWLHWRQIIGHFAHWAVRQIDSDEPYPPGLEKMVGYLAACTRSMFDSEHMAYLSLREVAATLHDILMNSAVFLSWNDSKVLAGWLDLDALITNVCVSIRDELRAEAAFDLRCKEARTACQ